MVIISWVIGVAVLVVAGIGFFAIIESFRRH